MSADKKTFIPTACVNCGGTVRLIALEPHLTLPQIEILTFECLKCGSFTVADVKKGEFHEPVK